MPLSFQFKMAADFKIHTFIQTDGARQGGNRNNDLDGVTRKFSLCFYSAVYVEQMDGDFYNEQRAQTTIKRLWDCGKTMYTLGKK